MKIDKNSLATFIHDKYENIAIEEGWITQKSTRQKKFKDLPESNKKVMLRLAEEVISLFEKRK